MPVRAYIKEERGADGLYKPVPENEGEIIFDRELYEDEFDIKYGRRLRLGRYWDTWTRDNRTHPLVVKVVEKLGKKAYGPCAKLKVVEIPDGIDWEINEYDGLESVRERSRSWS